MPFIEVIGGTWGPALLGAISAECTRLPRQVDVVAASVEQPSLTGARVAALDLLRAALVSRAGSRTPRSG